MQYDEEDALNDEVEDDDSDNDYDDMEHYEDDEADLDDDVVEDAEAPDQHPVIEEVLVLDDHHEVEAGTQNVEVLHADGLLVATIDRRMGVEDGAQGSRKRERSEDELSSI